MLLADARTAGSHWVVTHAVGRPWFVGAHFAGSSVGQPGNMQWPPTSDVDLVVLTDGPGAPDKPGKILYRGALLEVSIRPWERLSDPNKVLMDHHLAPSFRLNTVISDPTGRLTALHRRVATEFAKPRWIRARYTSAKKLVALRLKSVDTGTWHDRVLRWLFGTGTTTHVLLIAKLQNPTGRLRYVAVREVLYDMGRPDVYEEFLDHLGVRTIRPAQVTNHISALSAAVENAAAVLKSSFPFNGDLSGVGRRVAIGGSADLVAAGYHREAVFWIAVTFARCRAVLTADGDPHAHAAEFDALLAELGIPGPQALAARAQQVLDYLPVLDSLAENLIAAG